MNTAFSEILLKTIEKREKASSELTMNWSVRDDLEELTLGQSHQANQHIQGLDLIFRAEFEFVKAAQYPLKLRYAIRAVRKTHGTMANIDDPLVIREKWAELESSTEDEKYLGELLGTNNTEAIAKLALAHLTNTTQLSALAAQRILKLLK